MECFILFCIRILWGFRTRWAKKTDIFAPPQLLLFIIIIIIIIIVVVLFWKKKRISCSLVWYVCVRRFFPTLA